VPLLNFKRENIEIVEIEVGQTSPFANRTIADMELPDGVLVSAILRKGKALLPAQAGEIVPDDYLICLLEPGRTKELIHAFLPEENPDEVQSEGEIDVFSGESPTG